MPRVAGGGSGGSRRVCRECAQDVGARVTCVGKIWLALGEGLAARAQEVGARAGVPPRAGNWELALRAQKREGRALRVMGEALILHEGCWGLAPLPVKGREAIGLPRGAQRV